MPHGIPEDRRCGRAARGLTLPALLPFPNRASLLLRASGAGRAGRGPRAAGGDAALPDGAAAGKVRFTIIDPVGLGENFAAFMHLADYDEPLVGSRIWTEPATSSSGWPT